MLDPTLSNARLAGDVIRYHVWPTVRQQSVAHHSWNVLRIYIELFGSPEPNTTSYIVWHDGGELATGDIPFDAKIRDPMLKQISDPIADECASYLSKRVFSKDMIDSNELIRVKICDLAEMAEFAIEECRLGNKHYGLPIADKIMITLDKKIKELPNDADRHVCQLYYEFLELQIFRMEPGK